MSTNLSTSQLQQLDARHHWHPFSDMKELNAEGSKVIVKGEGAFLTDTDGKTYLDAMAGLWCVNIGHGRREIADAVQRQMLNLSYSNTFFQTTHLPAIQLSEAIAAIAPDGFNRTFFTSSGSEANDTVIRMVRTYWDCQGKPEKSIIIARKNGYHGSTVGSASLGGMQAMHGQGGLPIADIHHIDQPYWFGEGQDLSPEALGLKAAKALETAIDSLGENRVAAFIAEPIQGAGGVIVPPENYWPEVKRILKERDILFVADEVIAGFGRLGTWFGTNYYDLDPDLMAIAKGLTSGYLPLGGVMMSDRFASGFEAAGEFYHGYTYSGHPACCAAGVENLRILRSENIVEQVATKTAPYLTTKWLALGDHPLVGEARMAGFLGALELVPAKPERHRFPDEGRVGVLARNHAVASGLIMRAVRDTMIISPPLTLTIEEVDQLIDLVVQVLDLTHRDLKADGLMG